LVLIQGAAMMFQSDLVLIFGPAGSHLRIVWHANHREDIKVAEEEKDLLSLALTSEIAHQRVDMEICQSWDSVPNVGRIIFSPRIPDSKMKRVAWVQIREEKWTGLGEEFDISQGHGQIRSLLNKLLLLKRG
jgi:hypothetical protein